jgi:regulator of replication initiation timing
MTDEEAPWSRGLFAPALSSVPDEAPSIYAEITRLREEVTELTEENALIRRLANKYLAENTAIKAEVGRLADANAQLQEIVNSDASEEERLRAEVERMREALGEAVMLLDNNQNNNPPHMQKYLAKWEAALTPYTGED